MSLLALLVTLPRAARLSLCASFALSSAAGCGSGSRDRDVSTSGGTAGSASQTGGNSGASGAGGSSSGATASGGAGAGATGDGGALGGAANGSGGAASGSGGTANGSGGAASGSGGAASGSGGTAVGGAAGAPAVAPFPALAETVTVHIAGDSTAAIFPPTDATLRVGWASVLQQFFASGVQVDDLAQSGRSSKSFIDEGFWAALKGKIKPGDYVFVEFGHNDEKTTDATRYTDPATTFRTYLKTYISETRAAGGYAVLLTPISRRKFVGDKISATHGAYPAAVIAVGRETGTPVIDMTEKTRIYLEGLGPVNSVPLFAVDDETHLSAKGAPEVAKLAVQGIRELSFPIAQRLVP